MFGNQNKMPLTENSIMDPASPYGASKLFAYHLVKNYRESYELPFSGSYLFLKTVPTDKDKSMDFFRKVLEYYNITKEIMKKNVLIFQYLMLHH